MATGGHIPIAILNTTDSRGEWAMSANHDTENPVVYKDIPGFPGYRAGSDGTIWSCWKMRGRKKKIMTDNFHQILPTVVKKNKFYQKHTVTICNSDGKCLHKNVSFFILITFVSNQPEGKNPLHWDDNPFNNNVRNLRWGTNNDNMKDMVRNGKSAFGSRNPNAKLDDEKVIQIKKMIKDGKTDHDISIIFNVHRAEINRIRDRKIWKHIKD
jgi:hypothetical protein